MSSAKDMRLVSAVSDRVDSRAAVQQAVASLGVTPGSAPDLVIVFASPHHARSFGSMAAWLRAELGDTLAIGASSGGVIGAGIELEGREGLSLTAAWLPDTRLHPVHLPEAPRDPKALSEQLGVLPSQTAHWLVLPDPGSCDADALLKSLDALFPQAKKIGGAVGGAEGAAFFIGDRVVRGGALLCAIDGPCKLATIVAQGCRPIGEPFIVTRNRGHIIDELNAGKPTQVLRELHDNLGDRDKALFDTSLLIGIEMGDKGGRYEAGDFLIREVMGIDRERGSMAVGARVSEYQVVQFHLRDREAAEKDLARQLRRTAIRDESEVRGALLFSCFGRGERLFGVPNHDSDAFLEHAGPISLSGMFCNGEIGPVGGKTFLHGYTSVFGVFSEPRIKQ